VSFRISWGGGVWMVYDCPRGEENYGEMLGDGIQKGKGKERI
jgi:hypothetical protein